jgi:putative copper export protein
LTARTAGTRCLIALALLGGAIGQPPAAAALSHISISPARPSVQDEAGAYDTEEEPEPGPTLDTATVSRWLAYVGVLALIGACGFQWLARRGFRAGKPGESELADRLIDGCRRAGVVAAALLLVGLAGRLYGQVLGFLDPGEPLTGEVVRTIVGSSRWGTGWALQLATALAALAALLAAGRRRIGWIVATVAVAAVALATPLTGHAMAGTWGPVAGESLHLLHLAAGGAWLGTLLVLLLVGYPALGPLEPTARAAALQRLVGLFSRVAMVGAGAAVAVGLVLTWSYVGSVAGLWSTSYGRALLVKVGLLVGVAALGAYNWRRVQPVLDRPEGASRLRRSGGLELLLGALLLAATAVLVALPAPRI